MKLKKIYFLFFVFVFACTEDKPLGKIGDIESDYILPQGKSPSDDRIVDFYNQFGTYILYDFTRADFDWVQVNGTISSYVYTEADPLYAGKMLDMLYDVWFDFYPEDFLKKYLPYKIFLTSTLGILSETTIQYKEIRFMETQMALAYCSDTLDRISPETILSFKNNLQKTLWEYYGTIFDIPEEFYAETIYSRVAVSDPTSSDYMRTRGFISYQGDEWSLKFASWFDEELDSQTDLFSYLTAMVTRTSKEWEGDLQYPLVKQKYDILRNWLNKEYGFDIQKIGDAVYE